MESTHPSTKCQIWALTQGDAMRTAPHNAVRDDAGAAGEHPTSRLLDGMTKLEAESILKAASKQRYVANSVVMNQGDPAERFFLLTTGCARLFFITYQGRKVLLRWLSPGEILGGAALLPEPSNYLVSTEVVKDSSVLVWDRNTIRKLAAQYPKLFENTLPFASDHLAWFLAAQTALISSTARERLTHVVLSLAQGIGYKVCDGVQLDITNEQLANAANITPFTASRLLSQWQRNGAVAKERGKLILRAPQRLLQHQI